MPQLQNRFLESAVVSAATCAARRATFQGRPFRVVPAVLVRAQVLRNNLGTTFLPAEEITDDWAAQWNGTPVLVGPHPSMQGVSTSGRTPEIWDARGAGWIFYARAENGPDGTRRLVGEVWLDESRAATVPGLQAVLTSLDANQPVELSTGFGVQADEQTGVHNGESYDIVLHPMGADHLVISTEMTGACAVADGCGLGANEKEQGMDEIKTIVQPTTSNDAPATPAPVKDVPKANPGIFKAVLGRVAELFGKAPETAAVLWEKHETMRVNREIVTLQLSPSDDERRQMLREALQAKFGSSDREVIVCDVYTDPERYVVFWFMTALGPMPAGAEYYQMSWVDADNDGIPELSGTQQLVRRMTSYEPVGSGPAGDGAGNATTEKPAPAVPVAESEPAEEAQMVAAITGLSEQVRAASERLEALKV